MTFKQIALTLIGTLVMLAAGYLFITGPTGEDIQGGEIMFDVFLFAAGLLTLIVGLWPWLHNAFSWVWVILVGIDLVWFVAAASHSEYFWRSPWYGAAFFVVVVGALINWVTTKRFI